jgi:hypothetical protein
MAVIRVSQLGDICSSLLDRQGGLGNECRKWLTSDIRVRLECTAAWCITVVREAALVVETHKVSAFSEMSCERD